MAAKPLYLHYKDSSDSIAATSYEKTALVSHWMNFVSVQEDYEVYHNGPKYT